ncbi:transcription factor, contains a PHD finger motif [Sorochytrium milnesiophthora]
MTADTSAATPATTIDQPAYSITSDMLLEDGRETSSMSSDAVMVLDNPASDDNMDDVEAAPSPSLPLPPPSASRPPAAIIATSAAVKSLRLPTSYDTALLDWNELHTLNAQNQYCYCGEDRVLDELMLQCRHCNNWFHKHCLSVEVGRALPFFTTYAFTCSMCSSQAVETYQRQQCAWKDVTCQTIALLMLKEIKKRHILLTAAHLLKNPPDTYYFLRDDIVAFVDSHWSSLWTNRGKVDSIWKGTLSTTLYQYREVFVTNDKVRITGSPFTLFDQNLFNIRPGWLDMFSKTGVNGKLLPPSMSASVTGRVRDREREREEKQKQNAAQTSSASTTRPTTGTASQEPQSALGKRSTRSDRGNMTQAQRQQLPTAVLPQQGADHPFNRDGYKYNPARINPYLRYAAYRECNGSPQFGPGVYMSREDRSPYIAMDRDGLTVWGEKGFRSARASTGVKEGDWYFEVFVNRAGPEAARESSVDVQQQPQQEEASDRRRKSDAPHVRLGVTKREATLLGPVGYDDFGFGYRDSTGEKLRCSRPQPYGDGFASGDVIGVYLSLPPWTVRHRKPAEKDGGEADPGAVRPKTLVASVRHKIPIKYKNNIFFESKDYLPLFNHPPPSASLVERQRHKYPTIPRSKLIFFKNGKSQGIAFEDLPAPIAEVCAQVDPSAATRPADSVGKSTSRSAVPDDGSLGYYPTASLFKGGSVTMNFGPFFMYSPNPNFDPDQLLPAPPKQPSPSPAGDIDDLFDELHAALDLDASDALATATTAPPPSEPEPVVLERTNVEELKLKALLKSPLLPSQRWRPFTERFFEREVEEALCDLVDEVEYWHAYDYKKDKSLLVRHAVRGTPSSGAPTSSTRAAHNAAAAAAADAADANGLLPSGIAPLKGATVLGVDDAERQRVQLPPIQFEYPSPYDRFEMVEGEARVFDPAAPPSVWGLSNGSDQTYVKRRVRIKWASED